MWDIYKDVPSFVLGFHGCDQSVGEQVLSTQNGQLNPSDNAYDWLGTGIYFWEASPERALQFAEQAVREPRLTQGTVTAPFVLGAAIDLGLCCNLLDAEALEDLKQAYEVLLVNLKATGAPLPENKGEDRAARFLDRAVIQTMHEVRRYCGLAPYDTVRAVFWEGSSIYPGASFATKNHVQIAVLNAKCVKGYFRPFQT